MVRDFQALPGTAVSALQTASHAVAHSARGFTCFPLGGRTVKAANARVVMGLRTTLRHHSAMWHGLRRCLRVCGPPARTCLRSLQQRAVDRRLFFHFRYFQAWPSRTCDIRLMRAPDQIALTAPNWKRKEKEQLRVSHTYRSSSVVIRV
jgi:hypothetical protein